MSFVCVNDKNLTDISANVLEPARLFPGCRFDTLDCTIIIMPDIPASLEQNSRASQRIAGEHRPREKCAIPAIMCDTERVGKKSAWLIMTDVRIMCIRICLSLCDRALVTKRSQRTEVSSIVLDFIESLKIYNANIDGRYKNETTELKNLSYFLQVSFVILFDCF